MTRLNDDCFAPAGEMMRLADALTLLAEKLGPAAAAETAPLKACLGRVLAEDVVATRDVPPHDNSAMDGYAVFFDDLDGGGETRLEVAGRIAAGHPLEGPPRRRCAYRIFTGAAMPEGPDTVVIQEDCRTDGTAVILPAGVKQGANRRFRGEDVAAGSAVIARGRVMRAQEIGLAASLGLSHLKVYAPLRAAVFSTGDEIRDPSQDAPEGCIFDANRYSVIALLDGLGCTVTDLGILPDDLGAIQGALAAAAPDHDLLITSGGVSLGEEDHVKAAVEALGGLHFWRLAIKPGKPIALGVLDGTAFIGLPGNPVSAMITFMLVGRPVVSMLSGRSFAEPPRFKVGAGFDFKKKPGRREWLRGRLERQGDGQLSVLKYPSEGSGILKSMVESDGLIELPEDLELVNKGDMVDFFPFNEVV